MIPAIANDTLTPIISAQFASRDLVGGRIMDFLADARLSKVSRIFRDANRQSMMRTVRQLRGRDPQELAKIDAFMKIHLAKIPENLFPSYDRFFDQITSEKFWPDRRSIRIVREARAKALRVDDPQEREHNSYTLCAMHHLEGGVPELAARLHTKQLCQAIAEEEDLDPTQPEQVSPFLAALHQRQKHEAYALGERAAQTFRENMAIVDHHHVPLQMFLFVQREQLLDGTIDTNLNGALSRLWQIIAPQINIARPHLDATAREIRNWMNDPAHEQALSAITHLSQRLDIIPPEIGRLRGVQSMTAEGALTGLPPEMEELQNLRTLGLYQTTFPEFPAEIRSLQQLTFLSIAGRFSELPEWLAEMPALRFLKVTAPVRELPDAIWRRYYGLSDLDREFYLMSGDRLTPPLEINSPHLTEIPFSCWFKENIHVPYVGFFLFFEEVTRGISECLTRWRSATSNSWLAVPFWLFLNGPAFGILFLMFGIHYLLNLPAFLINLLLNYAVEPALTALRDELGYSRMVHARLGDA